MVKGSGSRRESFTFCCLEVRLLDEVGHPAGELEDDRHGFAATHDRLVALWPSLALESFASTSRSLVVQLLVSGSDSEPL